MRFSIIIPAHNAAGYIRKALDSVACQTFKDYELIVVCDACDDNTAEIAREYTDKVIEEAYHSDGPSRQRGLDAAAGDWILFMDDDDWWLHEYVLVQLDEEIGDDDLLDVLCFGFIWKHRGYTSPRRPGGNVWPAVWNKAYRRTSLAGVRFVNIHPADLPWTIELFQKDLFVRKWDMPLYYYNYWRPGSLSVTTNQPDFRFEKD